MLSIEPQTEDNPVTINSEIDTYTVVHPYDGIPLSHKTKQNKKTTADATWVNLTDFILNKKKSGCVLRGSIYRKCKNRQN